MSSNNNVTERVRAREVVVQEGVTTIQTSTYRNDSTLTSIIIPNSVTTIEECAFACCHSLKSINIPSSVTTIEERAFDYCYSLKSIHIPSSVITIGPDAFYGCKSLKSINIPSSVTTIGSCAFACCSSLKSINIPNSVTTIGEYAFHSCTSLTSVNIPNSVTTIEVCAFEECSSLTSVNIPNSVTTIEYSAFKRCTSLTSVNIPNSVTTIGPGAFNRCTSLLSIVLPSTEINIADDAFDHCKLLAQRRPNGTNYNLNTNTWLQQRFADMPIHQACYRQDITPTIVSNLIQANNDTTLALTDAMGMTALHVLCCNPNATADAIKVLRDAYTVATSARNVAGMTPLMMLLKCKNCLGYDGLFVNGELVPLVRLLELGVECDVLEIIMNYENRLVLELENRDEVSNLLPFMQAAVLPSCTLETVYMLATKYPHLLLQRERDKLAAKRSKTAEKELSKANKRRKQG